MSSMDRREMASPLEPDLDREGHGDLTGKPKARARAHAGETPGIEAPGPLDRALDRDRDDRADILEGTTHRARGTTARDILADQGATRIPVAEERLEVEKRPADLGAVQVRKTVTEERQTVPVTLEREEVRVREVNLPDRPLQPGDDAFNEGALRVPVRGEEAVVAKEAVVTGEVVVDKARTTERQQVSDTVRKEHVDTDERYQRARPGFERDFRARQAAATDDWSRNRTFAQAEPHYQAGFSAAQDARYADRTFEDAEPELRREYEARGTRQAGRTFVTSGPSTGMATDMSAGDGDSWERLREDIRAGWNHVRHS